ncbi:MAG: two-component regulator propeller domain-containing protein, partial [Candidatus Cloacimonadaceae bacterium]|nr:two-component regulator propeller domain-containing protein [Candidatus Cloacimonadaceae bacterium]
VKYLEIDSLDRVWMGFPYEGIARLTGTEMTVYNENNSPLPSSRVTALEVDSQNRIWVGLTDGGTAYWLAMLDGNVWTIYNSANSGLPSSYIFTIEVRDGVVWIGTNQGLVRFDGTNWEVWTEDNSGLPSNSITAIAFDSDGHLLAGTTQHGLAHFADGQWLTWNTSNSGIAENGCSYLYVVPDDQIWIGCLINGVSVFEHGASGTNDPGAVPVARILKVSPNPFTCEVSISGLDVRLEREISLFNLRGQKLAKWTVSAGQEARLDLSAKGLKNLPAGVYLWQARSGSEIRRGKAVKIR